MKELVKMLEIANDIGSWNSFSCFIVDNLNKFIPLTSSTKNIPFRVIGTSLDKGKIYLEVKKIDDMSISKVLFNDFYNKVKEGVVFPYVESEKMPKKKLEF